MNAQERHGGPGRAVVAVAGVPRIGGGRRRCGVELYESASRTSAVLALNVEDLDLPNKQARITAKGGDTNWPGR